MGEMKTEEAIKGACEKKKGCKFEEREDGCTKCCQQCDALQEFYNYWCKYERTYVPKDNQNNPNPAATLATGGKSQVCDAPPRFKAAMSCCEKMMAPETWSAAAED